MEALTMLMLVAPPDIAGEQDIQQLLEHAEMGNASAQVRFADLYFSGQGLPQDKQRAAERYRRAAHQGDSTPQNNWGAGDSFDTGFLHSWLRGRPLQDCLYFAAACGALSTRGMGGTATQATEEEAESYLHAHIGY